MSNAYDLVVELTDSSIEPTRRLNDFATASGWRPSDKLIFSRDENTPVTAHLLVEHGLADTAVISFLRYPKEIARMDQSAINELLSVSYNNMSDWQICIDRDNVSFIFNRTDPYRIVSKNPINYNNTEFLLNSAFKKISSAAPRPSLLSLEEALIQTIKHWKRILTAELSAEDSDDVLISLTNLFNAIIFVRAIEDHAKRHPIGTRFNGTPSLKERWEADQTKISKVILDSLRLLNYSDLPTFLGDDVKIEIFDRIDQSTISSLINDFYKHKYIPYYYDFSIISKHALSRIYERYVSIMRIREIPQQSLSIVPDLPSEEEQAKAFGAHFTPQYIARFFARYLKDQVTPLQFRNLKIADPAVGSGIFLRTILEIQSDPNLSNVTTESIERQFSNVLGIDKDPNAANAARLSLSLLHLERTERLPSELKIYATDSLTYFNEKIKSGGSFDAIFANPPFVSWDNLEPKMRDLVTQIMDDLSRGKMDLSLAFIKMSIDLLNPGGYGLFVLPHSFLINENAENVREYLKSNCWIRCIADLSARPVFDVGSYITLLIFQKKPKFADSVDTPDVTVIKCQDYEGRALEEALEGKKVRNSFYTIYNVNQSVFKEDKWYIVPPEETTLRLKFNKCTPLEKLMHVSQGVISAADNIFIKERNQIPKNEEKIYKPFLPDRFMQAYSVPRIPPMYMFYPYEEGKLLPSEYLSNTYPQTWKMLIRYESNLSERKSLQKKDEWWQLISPRLGYILQPKIVTPHLVLVPRFSLDMEGKFLTSHGPVIYPRHNWGTQFDGLKYILGILNSTPCYWYISKYSSKYSRSYARLEVNTLKSTPIPDPKNVDPLTISKLINLVDKRMECQLSEAYQIEREIDQIVAELYQLTDNERSIIGMGKE